MTRGKSMRAVLILLLTFSANSVIAAEGPLAEILTPILKQAQLAKGQYGIEVRELRGGKILFSEGADLLFTPASSIKVLIAATALSRLGPNYRFKTLVRKAGNHLCLIGRGDPSLVDESVWLLAKEVRRKGVRKIADLIGDDSYFSPARDYSVEFEQDFDQFFAAPVSALSVNSNSLTLHVEPTRIGKPPRILLESELPIFQIRNQALTTSNDVIGGVGTAVERSGDFLTVSIRGNIFLSERITRNCSVPDPALYTAGIFAKQFRRAGGKITGKIRAGICPATGTQELLEFSSKPLSQIVFDLNKTSNNFIAEMLLRAVGTEPNAESGLRTLREWLSARGIEAPGLVLENASGFSRKTRISARTLGLIVRAAAVDLAIAPEFLASLSIGGVDGTLGNRFSATPSKLRAKTGNMSGIVSLTGVFQTVDGVEVVFSTLFNFPMGDNGEFQRLEERLVAAIVAAKTR
ncbi:MAG: D-alanyl-D-alanine carboxypeptidase/D-alanyl-D-alanine-endopeptidase [Pseudomonadota bacterium]